MNPLVWRFMGGVTVATAVDLVVPGYSRILFAGLGAALPEGSKKAGVRRGLQKGLEHIGKAEWKVLSSPKYFGRFAVRTIPKLGLRVIPVIGWAWMAGEATWWLATRPGMIPMIVDNFDIHSIYGPMTLDHEYSGPQLPF